MVNPGIFHGSRYTFLIGEKPAYTAGVDGGYAGDALAKIQARYFKRYPIELPLDEEQSIETLAAIDDDAPDEEHPEPDRETLLPEEYEAEVTRLIERSKLITVRKAVSCTCLFLKLLRRLTNLQQIKRWLAYQYMKDHDIDPKDSGKHNPYRALLYKLTGLGAKKPRLRSACNTWRKLTVNRDLIEVLAKAQGATKKNGVTVRGKIASDLFAELSAETKEEWAALAVQEHEEGVAAWKLAMTSPPSTLPVDRQK